MSSGRQATKIKEAGDTSTDYQITAGKFSFVEITAQAAGTGSGTGVVLLEASDITTSFIYDVGQESFDIGPSLLPPENATVFDNGDFFFTPERVSNDGGVTWIEPRVAGGRWVLGLQAYTTNELTAYLFEFRPGEGLAYIDDRAALTYQYAHTHVDLDVAFANASNIAKIAVFGPRNPEEGFRLMIGDQIYYTSSHFGTAVRGLTGPLTNDLTVEADDVYIGNCSNDYTSGHSAVFRLVDGLPTKMGYSARTDVTISTNAFSINNDEFTKATKIVTCVGNSTYAFFLLGVSEQTNGYNIAYVTNSVLYACGYSSTLSIGGYSNISLLDLEDEGRVSLWLQDGNLNIITDTAKYVAPSIHPNGTFVRSIPYEITETEIVALTNTFGFSGEKYTKTSNIGGTDWLGNTVAKTAVISTANKDFLASSVDAALPNTQSLIPIAIPVAAPDQAPTIVSGIMANGGDKIRVVSTIKMNLNVSGVEQ